MLMSHAKKSPVVSTKLTQSPFYKTSINRVKAVSAWVKNPGNCIACKALKKITGRG